MYNKRSYFTTDAYIALSVTNTSRYHLRESLFNETRNKLCTSTVVHNENRKKDCNDLQTNIKLTRGANQINDVRVNVRVES